jgi:hypothetical protein
MNQHIIAWLNARQLWNNGKWAREVALQAAYISKVRRAAM